LRFLKHGEQTYIVTPAFAKLGHQLAEGSEALFVDAVGITLLGEADGLDAQEHERLLARSDRGIGDDEGHRGLVRIVLRVGEADAELVGHDSAPFRLFGG
jgi:hypothetical protein